jgi:hypothetical protein
MPESWSIAEAEWLTTPESQPWLEILAATTSVLPSLVARLRGAVGPPRTAALLELWEARRRAASKFPRSDELFFTRKGLEQSTDVWIAAWKAQRFRGRSSTVDLGCGIGGDLMGLAAESATIGVDCDPVSAHFARCNIVRIGLQAGLRVARVEELDPWEFDGWHCDPDRRTSTRRTTRVQFSAPSDFWIDRWRAALPHGAIKLAPAAGVPPNWCVGEREWIESRGECRQQLVWFGELARNPGLHTATLVPVQGEPATFSGPPNGQSERTDSFAGRDASRGPMPKYLFEPTPSILAAKLTRAFAREYELEWFDPAPVMLCGDAPRRHPLLQSFEVLEAIPFDRKRLVELLRHLDGGTIEVKTRGVRVDAMRAQEMLRLDGSRPLTVLLLPRGGSTTAVVARRIDAETNAGSFNLNSNPGR